MAENGREPTDVELLARFVENGEKAAFEALVRRHSPMVMGVCRRTLGDAHEAEDAFQATFMVLLRKAKSISRPELLANWLYGVAFRVARKARIKAARQQPGESSLEAVAADDPYLEPEWGEVKTALDEELSQLPEKYRLPLVLCYLNGKTNIEAARLLGCPDGSIANRLSTARAELKKRLLRRGMVLPAALLALFLEKQSASAGVPEGLLEATLDGACDFFARLPQVPTGSVADAAQSTTEAAGPSASAPLAECRPASLDERIRRKFRRKLRRCLQSLLWLFLFSWIVFPVLNLAGISLAGVPRGVQDAWSLLTASGISPARARANGTAVAHAPAGVDNPGQGPLADGAAGNDERCKRCLGTKCGNSEFGLLRSNTSGWLLHTLFLGR